jgi:single-strand DNA-binding protein
MSIATVTVTGFVASDPKLLFTKQSQTPVVHLRVGTTLRRVDTLTGEWRDGASSFFTANCWRRLALNVSASVHKGDPVIVRGRLRTRSWTDNGKSRTLVEIEAESVGHDMAFGWCHYLRGVHPSMAPFLDGPGSPDGEGAGALGWPGAGAAGELAGPAADADAPAGDLADGGLGLGAGAGVAVLADGFGPSAEAEAGRPEQSGGVRDSELAAEGAPF